MYQAGGAIGTEPRPGMLESQQQAPREVLVAERQRSIADQRAEQPVQNFESDRDAQPAHPRRAAPPPLPAAPQGEPTYSQPEDPMPRVARPEPSRPDPRSRQGDPLAESLGTRVRADLIKAAALYPWTERELALAVAVGEEAEPVLALKRLAGRAPHLYGLVVKDLEDYQAGVQQAYDQLRTDHSHETIYLDVLETEAAKLKHLMPLLMLSHGGPYQQRLEHMVYAMEEQAADGSLSPADRLIFVHAKQQIEALRSLADNRPDRLARVASIIDRYDERLPSHIAQTDQSRRTLN